MEQRIKDLSDLRQYTETIETELNTILQCLHWDQNILLEKPCMETCNYNTNHQMPAASKESHEKLCYLKSHDYAPKELFLPDVPDAPKNTICKLSNSCIRRIVNTAALNNPSFRRGMDNEGSEPLTLDRLHCTYTSDERRAIHDAVVSTSPALHDLSDLALPSGSGESKDKRKTRVEILAELRDIKRRRTKYRVPAATSKYSHVLRELIKTQMEFFTTAAGVKTEDTSLNDRPNDKYNQHSRSHSRPVKEEDKGHRSSYSSNQDGYHSQNSRTSSSTNIHTSREAKHLNDRHDDDSKYKSSTSYKSANSKRYGDKRYDKRVSRERREESDRRDRERCKRGRVEEDRRHSRHGRH